MQRQYEPVIFDVPGHGDDRLVSHRADFIQAQDDVRKKERREKCHPQPFGGRA